LGEGICIEAVGGSPVGHDVARFGEVSSAGMWVLVEPVPDLASAGVVVAGEAEVHVGSVFS
jgi:hypothetical protein